MLTAQEAFKLTGEVIAARKKLEEKKVITDYPIPLTVKEFQRLKEQDKEMISKAITDTIKKGKDEVKIATSQLQALNLYEVVDYFNNLGYRILASLDGECFIIIWRNGGV